jgi:hypothetical protein
MRPWILAALLVGAQPSAARSQTIEITPMAGFRFGGTLSATGKIGGSGTNASLKVGDGAAFGVHLGYQLHDGEFELLYSRQGTNLQTSGLFTGVPVLDLDLETFQSGGNYLFGEDTARAVPFIGFGLGFTRLLPKAPGLSNETRFSASFAGGVKVWLGKHVGLRLEGRMFVTVLDSESDRLCGSNTGCAFRTTNTELTQGEARGGLVLRF